MIFELKQAIYVCTVQKFFLFRGKASRSEFWYFTLFAFFVNIIATVLMFVPIIDAFAPIIPLIILFPSIAVSIRRLHDIGKNGYYILIPAIFFVLSIWLLGSALALESRITFTIGCIVSFITALMCVYLIYLFCKKSIE